MREHDEQHDDLPEGLISALRKGDGNVRVMTAKVDRELASLAADHFATRRAPARVFRPVWAAAAALALVAFIVVEFQAPLESPRHPVYSDVDGSGSIDIADVLALARDSDSVTQAELDAFAARIVSLSPDGEDS
ncbi:MAG: hypothetical protein ACE5F8_01440 [Woeseiaceae bacterium]